MLPTGKSSLAQTLSEGNFQSYSIWARPGRLINKDEIFTQTDGGLNVTAMNKHRSVLISSSSLRPRLCSKKSFWISNSYSGRFVLVALYEIINVRSRLMGIRLLRLPRGKFICAQFFSASVLVLCSQTSKIASSEFTREADKILLLSPSCSLFLPPGESYFNYLNSLSHIHTHIAQCSLNFIELLDISGGAAITFH